MEQDILEGTYANVLNAAQSRVYSSNGQFFYTPPPGFQLDNTHFDEVNVYYHINLYAQHLATDLDFTGLGQVAATCHAGHGDNPGDWSNGVFLGDGDGVNYGDAAKEDDWIYHEYQHGVSYYIGLQYAGEAAALHEGLSDYFAASFAQDPHIGRFTFSTASSTGDARNVANDPNYFNYINYNSVEYAIDLTQKGDGRNPWYINTYNDPHANGMIWSGLLWDIRSQFGANITDNLALEALYLRNGNATFAQEGAALIAADIILNNGTHVSTIENYLNQRGINWSGVGLPTMAVIPTTVASFGNVIVNTNSSQNGYVLCAANLLPINGNVTVTAPGGFQVSTTSGSGYASSISVAYTGGSINVKNVYVRFTPTAVQSYNGNITNSGGGAPTQYVAVSGAGVPGYTISGHISFMGSPCVGVMMNGLPGSPTTNSSGNYTATVPAGWTGTVTPTLSNFSFTPRSTTYGPVNSNITTNYTGAYGSAADQSVKHPLEFALVQNVPNPFNPTTIIRFNVPNSGFVSLKVYDILGREVTTLVNENQEAGVHQATFDGSRLVSGVYFYRLTAPGVNQVKKMLLTK